MIIAVGDHYKLQRAQPNLASGIAIGDLSIPPNSRQNEPDRVSTHAIGDQN